MFRLHTKSLLIFWAILFLGLPFFVFAQDLAMEAKCLRLTQIGCEGQDKATCQKDLQDCDQYYSAEAAKIQADINKTSQEKNTLKNKISSLDKKIKELTNSINQGNLVIKDIKIQIDDTTASIEKTTLKIEDSKNKLAKILRSMHEEDKKPLVEVLLAESDLSGFFDNMIALEILNNNQREILNEIKVLKSNLENQKISLDEEKTDLENTVKVNQLAKQDNSKTKKAQEYYLGITEQEYQKQLQDKAEIDRKAAEIKAKLFQLVGVSKAPTFGEALEVAKVAGSLVGVRPAFLLAIISQESAIGRNVGQCVLTDPITGAGKRISTGVAVSRLMKPSRDVTPFLSITGALGRDPYNTPVSCPLSVGYGGAMGPAQFIPSTWNLYSDKIKNALGSAGDPWAIKDSFTAAGIYLAELGASAQTASKESTAASRYYGGSSSYARQVMARASCIQSFVDSGTMSLDCENRIF